nr:alanine:cation symporter family protein [Microbacterium immunditiarum]
MGAVVSADLVWSFADGAMGFMALVNLIAIALLSGIAFRLLKDYTHSGVRGRIRSSPATACPTSAASTSGRTS